MSPSPESTPLISEPDPELQYPKLPLPLDEPHSAPQTPKLPAAMDTDYSSDATHDSLADSSYEIISERAAFNSDDDSRHDGTESLVSFTESVQDDPVSDGEPPRTSTPPVPKHELSMYDTSDEEDDDDVQGPHHPPAPEDSSIEDSCTTSNTVTQTPLGSIMFDEPPKHESGDSSEVVYALPRSERPYIRRWTEQTPQDAYRITIRQRLSPDKLRLGRSFRINYHGDLGRKEEITEKLAQALSISTLSDSQASELHSSSSRYNVIQLSSFGSDESSPQVTLIPSSGLELVVEDCAVCSKQHGEPASTSNKNTEFVRNCPNVQNGGHSPDLAVYCHSSLTPEHVQGENSQNSVSMLVRSARTAASGIPTLDIITSEAPCILRSFRPFKGAALHMCIESSRRFGSEVIISRMPIPVEHFLDVDARQMNRNLAFIIESRTDDEFEETTSKLSSTESSRFPFLWKEAKGFASDACITAQGILSPAAWLLISIALLALVTTLAVGPGALYSSTKTDVQMTNSTSEPSTASAATPIQPWNSRLETVAPTVKPETSLSIVNTETGVQLIASSDPMTSPSPDSHHKILLLEAEDGQLYIKLPVEVFQARRSPQVFATASIQSRPVDASLKKLEYGLYALNIDADRSRSAVNIVVWTDKKPNAQQYFRLEPVYLWPQYRKIERDIKSIMLSSRELSRWTGGDLKIVRKYVSGAAVASSGFAEKSVGFLRSSSYRAIDGAQAHFQAQRKSVTKAVQRTSQSVVNAAHSQVNVVAKSVAKRMDGLQAVPSRVQRSIADGALQTAKKVDRRLGKLNERISKVKLSSPEWPVLNKRPLIKARNRAKKLLRKLDNVRKQQKQQARNVGKTHARERPAAHQCDAVRQRCESTRYANRAGFKEYR